MTKTKAWIAAVRPRTLPLSVSGILLGSGVAHFNGFWDPVIFTLALVTTILFQILSNLANDMGDSIKGTDNKNRIGPTRSVQSGIISIRQMKVVIILVTLLSLLSSAFLIYYGTRDMPAKMIWTYAGLAVACIAAAIMYTVGRRAYGYFGLGDLMVLIFFGFVSVLGVYSLFAKSFLLENVLLALFVGLSSTAVLNLNNMRDYRNDAAMNKNTLVVRMGPNMAKFYHMLLVLIALISLGIFINKLDNPYYFLCFIPGAYLLYHVRLVMQITDPKQFDPELKKVALSTFALSLTLFLALMFT